MVIKFKVKFTSIDIHDDGDDGFEGKGEIYYNLAVNGISIASRDRDHPYVVGSGGSIPINQETEVTLPDNAYDLRSSFTVSGWVREQDSGFSGSDDDAGEFWEFYSGRNNGFGADDNHQVRLKDKNGSLDVTVKWRIETVSISMPPFGGSTPSNSNKEPNLKGIIVYEDWKFNQESDMSVPVLLRVRSQRFDLGEYDLPYEPEVRLGGRFGGFGKTLGVRPNTISSLKIGEGYYVELYDQPGRIGNKLTISENMPAIQADWNDRVKSLIVFRVPVPR